MRPMLTAALVLLVLALPASATAEWRVTATGPGAARVAEGVITDKADQAKEQPEARPAFTPGAGLATSAVTSSATAVDESTTREATP